MAVILERVEAFTSETCVTHASQGVGISMISDANAG